jgi:hypothetical protein
MVPIFQLERIERELRSAMHAANQFWFIRDFPNDQAIEDHHISGAEISR